MSDEDQAEPLGADSGLLDVLTGFFAELRAAGMPVSLGEAIDACEATEVVGLSDRELLKQALGATLIKSPEHRVIFLVTFDVYFSLRRDVPFPLGEASGASMPRRSSDAPSTAGAGAPSEEERRVALEELQALLRLALGSGDAEALREIARLAVASLAGVEPSRPVGVSYYLHRTLRALEPERLVAQLLAGLGALSGLQDPAAAPTDGGLAPLARRVAREEYEARLERFRQLVEAEIRRLLVEGRGAAAVAKSLRRPLLDDVDFMHATRDDIAAMRRAIAPLARSLAARLQRRRRHHRRGPLDFRATIRHSLSTGGVPIDPKFKPPHPSRPEIFVLADISGSVASFARFTTHLVYAISAQFSTVRSAVFIDGVDEVTQVFRRAGSLGDALETIAAEADVVHADGHSDYGSALKLFLERYGREITPRTNLLILGDARNNYHASESWVLAELGRRARRVFWLNPEPRAYWGSGDSIVEEYAPYCDGFYECRNLRQLKRFVEELV